MLKHKRIRFTSSVDKVLSYNLLSTKRGFDVESDDEDVILSSKCIRVINLASFVHKAKCIVVTIKVAFIKLSFCK